VAISINKNWLLLAGAIALGGLAFFLSNKAIQDRILQIELAAKEGKKFRRVVVPIKDLKPGDVIDENVVAAREVPEEFVNSAAVTPEQFAAISGQALTVGVKRGEPVLTTFTATRGGDLFSGILKKGRRALTFEVDEISSISGMLRAGDKIDLLLTAKPPVSGGSTVSNEKDFTFPMLSNVEVLATGQALKNSGEEGEKSRAYTHITLDLTPEEASKITAAKSGGKITAVLRNPTDIGPNLSRPITIDDVVASLAVPDANGTRTIPYIIGGGGRASASLSLEPILAAVNQAQSANNSSRNSSSSTSRDPALAAAPSPVKK
jgi:pilus assembly protein CpaB